MSHLGSLPARQKRLPERLPVPLRWRFCGVGAESPRVQRQGSFASCSAQRLRISIAGRSSGAAWKMSRSSCIWTSSTQSVGGPRAGDTGGGSSGSPPANRNARQQEPPQMLTTWPRLPRSRRSRPALAPSATASRAPTWRWMLRALPRRPGSANLAGSTITMPRLRGLLQQELGLNDAAITGLIAANPRKAVSLGDDGSSGHDVGKGSRYQPRRRAQ
jgi:hypothetical protein